MRGRIALAAILLAATSAAAAEPSPICPDRPSKSTGPCTVPQGRWQVETGLIDWSHDSSGGVHSDLIQWGNTAVKHGIDSRADIELWFTPLVTVSQRAGRLREHDSSFGDTLLRVKYALTSKDAPVQVALDPFVKLPTANHKLGNGRVEAGLLVPVAVPIGKGPLTFSLDPEMDLLADSDGHGRHAATQQVVNLGIQASDKLTLSAELWAMWDWDPAGTGRQASADGSIAYLVNDDLQLDGGINYGLNRQTADFELYTGLSLRF
jgi:hypothetical protein